MSKHRIGDPGFALSIQVDGLPRNVGPFASREAAFEWAREHSTGETMGSYHAYPITRPEDIKKQKTNILQFRPRPRA